MNIFRSYKRTRFFLWINIAGLAIGLSASIMLILFIVNELSYDKHFANGDRIVSINTTANIEGKNITYAINLRKAYTELPAKIPGIENAVQLYRGFLVEVTRGQERFQNYALLYTDPEFFEIFQMQFVEGTAATAFSDVNAVVITDKKAKALFGDASTAMGRTLIFNEKDYTITAVVRELPVNTHFGFDILANMRSIPYVEEYGGLEFHTYYLLKPNTSFDEVSAMIKKESLQMMAQWGSYFNTEPYCITLKLKDIYTNTEAQSPIGAKGDTSFVKLLTTLSFFILLLAIANFINMFIAQGETRIREIGIRKTNGARIKDIVRMFFSEVSLIVFISFVVGFFLTMIITPHFAKIIGKNIEMGTLFSSQFILSMVALFALTVIFSAFYPSFYLSRFNPLDILAKRMRFSKQRLIVVIVVFQSVVTIILMSFILLIRNQTSYLQSQPLGLNTYNVVSIIANRTISESFDALKQELSAYPEVVTVSGSHHTVGGGVSGQGIGLLDNREASYSINEYRVRPEMYGMMGFELVEGEFYKEETPDSIRQIVLNEAAIKMLDLSVPVVGTHVNYKGDAEIIGVVKDFYYGEPVGKIAPLVLTRIKWPRLIYIKFDESISRNKAMEIASQAFRSIDPGFIINPQWTEDIYMRKFERFKTQSKVMAIGSGLSLFIAILGLVAVHLYSTVKRTKEISIRRINGASKQEIFILLSKNIILWVLIAGVIAAPIAYYFGTDWLTNYENHVSFSAFVIIIPVIIQCIVAIASTAGVSLRVLSKNPVDSLKSE